MVGIGASVHCVAGGADGRSRAELHLGIMTVDKKVESEKLELPGPYYALWLVAVHLSQKEVDSKDI